jgi:sulfur carrier protein
MIMNVFVNNEIREVKNQLSISEFLTENQLTASKGVAIAINNEVIPKARWALTHLKENDRISVIRATQGG